MRQRCRCFFSYIFNVISGREIFESLFKSTINLKSRFFKIFGPFVFFRPAGLCTFLSENWPWTELSGRYYMMDGWTLWFFKRKFAIYLWSLLTHLCTDKLICHTTAPMWPFFVFGLTQYFTVIISAHLFFMTLADFTNNTKKGLYIVQFKQLKNVF